MNKKANTAVFILVATVFNLLLMGILLFGAVFLADRLSPRFGDSSSPLLGLIGFLIIGVPIVITFFAYGAVMRWVQKRWNLDQYLHPIFGRRRR